MRTKLPDEQLRRAAHESRARGVRALLRVISFERLVALWDACDGDSKPLGIDPYAIHVELVRRGEGWVCASC